MPFVYLETNPRDAVICTEGVYVTATTAPVQEHCATGLGGALPSAASARLHQCLPGKTNENNLSGRI